MAVRLVRWRLGSRRSARVGDRPRRWAGRADWRDNHGTHGVHGKIGESPTDVTRDHGWDSERRGSRRGAERAGSARRGTEGEKRRDAETQRRKDAKVLDPAVESRWRFGWGLTVGESTECSTKCSIRRLGVCGGPVGGWRLGSRRSARLSARSGGWESMACSTEVRRRGLTGVARREYHARVAY